MGQHAQREPDRFLFVKRDAFISSSFAGLRPNIFLPAGNWQQKSLLFPVDILTQNRQCPRHR